jgi:glutaredoxin
VLSEFPEARTFPQIVVNGQKIGGFEQFTKYIEDTNYTGTGHTL